MSDIGSLVIPPVVKIPALLRLRGSSFVIHSYLLWNLHYPVAAEQDARQDQDLQCLTKSQGLDAEHFRHVRQAYSEAPQASRFRLRLEAAEEVLPGREKIIVPAGAASDAIELFMTVEPGVIPGSR